MWLSITQSLAAQFLATPPVSSPNVSHICTSNRLKRAEVLEIVTTMPVILTAAAASPRCGHDISEQIEGADGRSESC